MSDFGTLVSGSRAEIDGHFGLLQHSGRIAQAMAGHESARTTGLYDGRSDAVALDEVEKVVYRLTLAIFIVIVLNVRVSDSLKQWIVLCHVVNRNHGNFHIEPLLQRSDHLVRQNCVTGIRGMDAIQRKEPAAECRGDALISNLVSMGYHVGEQTVEVEDTRSKLMRIGGDGLIVCCDRSSRLRNQSGGAESVVLTDIE